jgi:hypothetical protein
VRTSLGNGAVVVAVPARPRFHPPRTPCASRARSPIGPWRAEALVSGLAEALYPRLPIYLQNLACAWSGLALRG